MGIEITLHVPVCYRKLMQRTACSASQSRGSSPYCLLQSREIQNSGLGKSSPFFPQLSGFQLFPTCCCFWHVSSSRGSGGLCYSLSDYYRNYGHLHEKGSKCKLLILHNFFQFSFSFMISNYILSWPLTSKVAPIFQHYGLCMKYINTTPVKTSTCPCVLLAGSFCVITAFTSVHVVPNPLLFPF